MYNVLLYYKIVKVQHPETAVKMHKEICKALGIKGRVLIGADGINGTVAGSKMQTDLYQAYMNVTKPFEKIDFKESSSPEMPFPKMSVKVRPEIITTDDRENFNICENGRHVDRDTFHQWLVNKEDMVLLDMRNDYEWEIGRFVGSVRPPMKYFRDLKDTMDFYEQYKGKKIVMFCTGGIRCEPASAMFLAHGFDRDQIFQLEGGIVKYAEKYGDEGFYEGKCFVFDDRLAVEIDTSENAKIIGNCTLCETSCDTYRNCINRNCNMLFLGCEECMMKMEDTCSDECKTVISDPNEKRSYRANHVFAKNKVLHRNK